MSTKPVHDTKLNENLIQIIMLRNSLQINLSRLFCRLKTGESVQFSPGIKKKAAKKDHVTKRDSIYLYHMTKALF